MDDWTDEITRDRTQAVQAPPNWLREAARSVVFLRPRLAGLQAGPGVIVLLVALLVGLGVLLQRAAITGPAMFYWQAIGGGWLTSVLLLWVCWLVARPAGAPPGTATLFGLLVTQQLLISIPLWTLYVVALRNGVSLARIAPWLQWGYSLLVLGWVALAGTVLLWRQAASVPLRAAVVAAFAVTVAVDIFAPSAQFWYPDEAATRAAEAEAAESKTLKLSQEVMEAQSSAVIASLNAMQPQRPGVADVYAITFAPYAGEEVFRRESKLVTDLMASRFDAAGRTIQLLNHPQTAQELPWATGLNLQRAIQRAASLMDRDEDILFIHLTSHGARDGQLAASFWPVEVEAITPKQLRGWLDEAGIRYRVLSISACFSGSWLPVLAEPGTLVMTAADAEHTSYGCGHKSELTFFGRAMYGEELRRTRSFEVAHAQARKVIEQREKEAGKDDGYSNPLISVGDAIRQRLVALQARLDATGP
jgi:hypothetical protein